MQIFLHSCITVVSRKELPSRSLIMLKKHSTSSVVEALGCSTGSRPLVACFLTHSVLSIVVRSAVVVSRVKPLTLLIALQHLNDNCINDICLVY